MADWRWNDILQGSGVVAGLAEIAARYQRTESPTTHGDGPTEPQEETPMPDYEPIIQKALETQERLNELKQALPKNQGHKAYINERIRIAFENQGDIVNALRALPNP